MCLSFIKIDRPGSSALYYIDLFYTYGTVACIISDFIYDSFDTNAI